MMTFSDIFKKSFLEEAGSLTASHVILSMLAAFLCGMIVYTVYRNFYKGVVYNNNFNILLVMTSLVTCFMVIVITSNVVLSLGMVGALSIVRFRTAIKEPLDIAFLFWSIAVGIVLAAGLIPLAVIGSLLIGIVLLVFVNRKTHRNPYIAVISCTDHASELRVHEYLEKQVRRLVVKSKTAQKDAVELNLEIRLKDDNTDFVNTLAAMEGVNSAVLVSYNGDYMG